MKQLVKFTICLLMILLAADLSSAQRPELVVQTGHSDSIDSVAFSPDGKTLASGSWDKTIKLWDVSTGTELRTLKQSSSVDSVAFSPDGTTLASASSANSSAGGDATIKLWDISTGKELRTLKGVAEPISFSPDGKTLAGASWDGQRYTAKRWDVSTGKELRTLEVLAGSVAFSPDGKTIASGITDDTVKLWDAATGKELRTLKGRLGRLIAFSPDGKLLASANWDEFPSLKETVRLWDVHTGTVLRTFKESTDHVAFSPDGTIFATENDGGTITLWEVSTGIQLRTLEGEVSGIYPLAFSPDGKTLASGEGDGVVRLWQLSTGKELRALKGHANTVNSVVFRPDGKAFSSSIGDTIKLWGVSTGTESRVLKESAASVAFSPDGKTFASGGEGVAVKLWDVSTGTELRTFKDSAGSVAFSPDGKVLATGGGENKIKLWEVSTGRELRSLVGGAFLMAFSPDGKILASNGGDDTVELWNLSTGAKLRSVSAGAETIHSIAFSSDGKTLASGNNPQTITLWKVGTGVELRTLDGDNSDVYSVAFSPDGKILASGGEDGVVKLWQVSTGKELRAIKGHTNAVQSVVFSPDGKALASGSNDGTIKLWDPSSGKELASLIALDEHDWIVVTADGLFDGSPAAWNKIIWRFNNNTFDHAPVEAFFSDFYYPGLLEDILAGKHPIAPADISQKDRRQPQLKITLADAEANAALTVRNLTVKVDVAELAANKDNKTGSGAQDVRLFRNGSLVRVWHGDVLKGKTSATLEATIPIVAGANNFTAYAFNHDNIKSSDAALTVTGADSLKRKGTLHILAVGVSQYANREYNLDYTTDDATSFASQLKLEQAKRTQYQSVEIKTLLNESATKENILAELKKLAASAQPEDAVVVYFSGHGKASGDHFYLVPHDLGYSGSRDQLSVEGLQQVLTHSISDLELEEAFRDIDAGQMFMIIDACNSGQALENKDEPRRGPMNTRGLAQLAYEKGMYILTASQNVEEAFVSERLKHSYLTYALVEEGLKTNAADADHNGEVTLREWFNYALARVPKLREETLQSKSLEEVTPKLKAARTQKSQTPRVFYRREPEAQPWVVAKTPVTKQ
jgi:WD40 repeat protein